MSSFDSSAARRPRRLRLLVSLCALLPLFAGCGFHMVGTGPPWPAVLQRPYVSLKDPYTDFSREFEHQLKAVGADIQPVFAGATASIDVSRDNVEQRTLSVSASNIPTEYLLIYTVTFSVRGPDKELLAPQTLTLQQDYSFAENVVLAKEHEADILKAQMARNMVAIVMRRLASLK
jgi:outer membrane lipopolysaccharide assembly protein LptE/RlpB